MSSDYCGECGTGWWQLSANSQPAPASGGNPQHGQHARGPPAQNPAPWSYQGGRPRSRRRGRDKSASRHDPGRASQPQGLPQWPAPPKGAGKSKAPSAVATPMPENQDAVRQLLAGIRSHFGDSVPAALLPHVGALEATDVKATTKALHSCTHSVGACQKQLAEIRNVKAQYQQVWVDFLKQTLKTLRQQASEFQKKMVDLQSQEEQVQEKLEKAKLQLSQLSAGLEAKPEEAAEIAVSEPVRDVADMATVTALQQGIEELCSRHLVDTEQQAELPDPWVAPATPRPKAVKRPKAENGDGSDALSISSSPVPGKAGP